MKHVYCKSKYVNDDISGIPFEYADNLDSIKSRSITEAVYHKILYDKYKNIFYRFIEHPQSLKKNKFEYNEHGDKNYSLMILDFKLNIIDEIFLGNHRYAPAFSFVSSFGLVIYTNHYLSNEYKQNRLSYEIFNFNISK